MKMKSNKRNYFAIIVLMITSIVSSQELSIEDEFISSFMPTPGKYIVSGWVKEIHAVQPISYTSEIKINISSNATPKVVLSPSGQIIDGWQRIVGIIEIDLFTIDTFNPKLDIELFCSNTENEDCFFDDIRFFPYNGNLKSFVYDEDTQKLMAELDENNYATFYEYDMEGGLIRVKKETENGVFTIQETRSSNFKR